MQPFRVELNGVENPRGSSTACSFQLLPQHDAPHGLAPSAQALDGVPGAAPDASPDGGSRCLEGTAWMRLRWPRRAQLELRQTPLSRRVNAESGRPTVPCLRSAGALRRGMWRAVTLLFGLLGLHRVRRAQRRRSDEDDDSGLEADESGHDVWTTR